MINKSTIQKRLDCTIRVLKDAGDLIEKNRKKYNIVETKAGGDLVTNIDLEAEKIVTQRIHLLFPKDTILSEEKVQIIGSNEITWYVDPIDGTKDFVRDIPLYRTSLTCENLTEILIAGAYYPYLNVLYLASQNQLATKNKIKIRVSQRNAEESFVYFYPPNKKLNSRSNNQIWNIVQELATTFYRVRGDSNLLNALNWIASGSMEGLVSLYTDKCLYWRDVAPGILMVQQAGGKVTDIYGNLIINRNLSNGIVASNGIIHPQLLGVIQKSLKAIR